jgi:hypothetical protein
MMKHTTPSSRNWAPQRPLHITPLPELQRTETWLRRNLVGIALAAAAIAVIALGQLLDVGSEAELHMEQLVAERAIYMGGVVEGRRLANLALQARLQAAYEQGVRDGKAGALASATKRPGGVL